ncbi:MAG: hypothetical protein RBS34_02740 [Desulfofustis sp.]|jgi:hypothetical protein|nr:hypothetical protein [Desulfofustis sp.]
MKELLEAVRDRVQALTASLRFARRGAAEAVAIDIYLNAEPARQSDELAPFCLVLPRGGGVAGRRRRQVEAVFCLHCDDRVQAVAELATLESALVELSHPGGWQPWVQQGYEDYFGSKEHGYQPHPHYYYTVMLDFTHSLPVNHKPWRGIDAEEN